ncbi:hypothetical protein PG994_008991 [Apiospora phragmitis]|uniref:Uncharacterized protein n=1 Tax=Apiospora phragmitis TaxID=2905665 RepID=A0ABR1UI01_9PEZI
MQTEDDALARKGVLTIAERCPNEICSELAAAGYTPPQKGEPALMLGHRLDDDVHKTTPHSFQATIFYL